MNVYKEVKEIANCNAKIRQLALKLSEKIDVEGIEWHTAEFVTFTKDDEKHYRDRGSETEDFFVDQATGFCGDDFHGYLYFKTDVPGQLVEVWFEL